MSKYLHYRRKTEVSYVVTELISSNIFEKSEMYSPNVSYPFGDTIMSGSHLRWSGKPEHLSDTVICIRCIRQSIFRSILA